MLAAKRYQPLVLMLTGIILVASVLAAAVSVNAGNSDRATHNDYVQKRLIQEASRKSLGFDTFSSTGAQQRQRAEEIYSLSFFSLPTDLGISMHWGEKEEESLTDNPGWATTIHSRTSLGRWGLMLQLTQSSSEDMTIGALSGGDDFRRIAAGEGLIPAIGVSYTWEPSTHWIDSIIFYNDYTLINRDGDFPASIDFMEDGLNVTGLAVNRGKWYVYVDYVYGKSGDSITPYGAAQPGIPAAADPDSEWDGQLKINFGYNY